MAFQILLNFILAFIWMFLSGRMSADGFLIGFLLGAFAIVLMRRFFNSRIYLERLWSVLKLCFLFLKELILANISVLKVVLSPQLKMQPAFFKYETASTEDTAITDTSSEATTDTTVSDDTTTQEPTTEAPVTPDTEETTETVIDTPVIVE